MQEEEKPTTKKPTKKHFDLMGKFLAWIIQNDFERIGKEDQWKKTNEHRIYTTEELYEKWFVSYYVVKMERTSFLILFFAMAMSIAMIFFLPHNWLSFINYAAAVYNAYAMDRLRQQRNKRKRETK